MAKQVTGLLDKVKLSFEILKQNGGPMGSFYQLWRTDALKSGTTVGVDKYGNTYYENKRYFVGRSRWVVYNDNVSYDYDGSQVPAEWYGWLHYKTDLPPTIEKRVDYPWLAKHTENLTGTDKAYTPYSTTSKSKIQAWDPNAKKE